MSATYSISELAKEFAITTRTIRFYEDKGLLTPMRQGQVRVYSHKDRVHLKLILRGKRLGFSLDECQELIEMYTPGTSNIKQIQALLDKIAVKRQQLNQQLKDIAALQQELDTAEQRCLDVLKSTDFSQ
ncbi:MerR family DNA-binding transcriptional regulator [Endozoicomonas sp. SM1973]|uniref:MerR family DNA-binding transcriptional regulator n=1 Tax=Spartinivicinus marinus TaxID=2994442 RepID=A0A853ICC9_9GAMM|nr:MerR family DNA-binding transcriptional regulator [Spartinivicinus marinus]MCX4029452.1 MerR family DNA-binding transcriptional regulator [Spartinivicinus marinus]NYZ65026.1 MerR family DNA-binding transcriptional regulator [Spartinivicinus marinus]